MEVIMKLRLLLTSALFVLAQIPAPQAQVTVDVAKITCEEFMMQKLAWTSRDIELWFSGYFHGTRNNPIVDVETTKENEEKLNSCCYKHGEATVLDAVKNVLGEK
jgi:acid stress chaperone HdeB